ncbi:MAG: hypothetical protein ACK5L5_03970 [Bacteroidales bacterium]
MLESLKRKSPFIKSMAERYGYVKGEMFRKGTRASYGDEHKDKTFYIVGGVPSGPAGLFAFVRAVFLHASYAKQKGFIPIVDMHNYPNQYQRENPQHDNVWEIFFEQPDAYRLCDIKQAKKVILCKPFSRPNYSSSKRLKAKKLHKYIYTLRSDFKQHIRLSASMQSICQEKYRELIGQDRVLGVLARGSDYTLKKPKYHAIQPEAEQLITEARQVMQKYDCNKIFLASEDATIVRKFKTVFGDQLITNQQRLYNNNELEDVNFLSEIREHNKIDVAKEYLQSIYILSKCPCFIAGYTAGSLGASLLSDGYEYEHIWDLGTYS